MLHYSYCAFVSTLSVAGISERFKISIFKGFIGLAGTVAQGDDLSRLKGYGEGADEVCGVSRLFWVCASVVKDLIGLILGGTQQFL